MGHGFPTVWIWVALGKRQAVGDVVRAAELLLKHWPDDFSDTALHRDARMACLEAWEGEGDPLDARAAFVEAAEEAGILAEA
ncbi:DUF982 domain-containing protein [Kaistia granuli]|uniref:DUF982 domain-containing protein n=1 Tax=Kaistia granuli TaxID=363259 RepID=UPI00035CF370|nr:DUF982 domain-containing protein [Kaistia granuli]